MVGYDISQHVLYIRIIDKLSRDIGISCGRCLKEVKKDFNREIEFNYAVDKSDSILDLDSDIREEIILDYPIKPLCDTDCKGLCLKCGANLNEGGCNCGTT